MLQEILIEPFNCYRGKLRFIDARPKGVIIYSLIYSREWRAKNGNVEQAAD